MIALVQPKHTRQTAGSEQRKYSGFVSHICAGLAGAVIALSVLWSASANAAEPRVLLLRGWFGVFSTGLDGIADELKANGINAEVAGHLYWESAVADILREHASGSTRPIVLIGHSQGANNVIDMARALEAKNIPVDLLVTLAPYLQAAVPSNVVRAVNFYQAPGWGAPLEADRGFHGKLENNDMSGDWTITHISIDKSSKVHAEILRDVMAVARDSQPARPARAAARAQ